MTDRPKHYRNLGARRPPARPPLILSDAPRSQWADAWYQFRHHRGAMAGMFCFFAIILFVTVGPYIWTVDPGALDTRNRFAGPSPAHPMGTMQLGQDVMAQVMFGGRISLAVGLVAMFITLLLGTLIGVLAGFFKSLDGILMRLTDLFLALPVLPLLLVIIMLFREPLSQRFGTEARDLSSSW